MAIYKLGSLCGRNRPFSVVLICFLSFQRIDDARLRWLQEDEFNSLQKRGFAAEHDMSRSSNSQTVWKPLMFIAFTLSQLMKLSILGSMARGTMAMRNWIK